MLSSLFSAKKKTMASLLDSLTTRSFFSLPSSIPRISSPLASSPSFASSSLLPPSVLSYSHQHSHSRFPYYPVAAAATLDGQDELEFEEVSEEEDSYPDDESDEEEEISIDISILEKEARDIVRDYATTLSRELKLGKDCVFFFVYWSLLHGL